MDQGIASGKSLRISRILRGLIPVLAFLIIWEAIARTEIYPPVLFPSFSTVMRQCAILLIEGQLLADVATTMMRAMAGFVLAVAIGILVGLMMGRSRLAHWFFEPLIALGFPMPTITLIPIFILWFGTGDLSKIMLVVLTCFFPMALSTAAGVQQVDQYLVWSARMMGTSEHSLIWRIILPATLPFILSSIRITLPLSLIIAFVGEMVGGGGGLGYTLMFGYRFLDTPTVFAVLLTMLVLGFVMDRALLIARRSLLPWHEDSRTGGSYE